MSHYTRTVRPWATTIITERKMTRGAPAAVLWIAISSDNPYPVQAPISLEALPLPKAAATNCPQDFIEHAVAKLESRRLGERSDPGSPSAA